MRTNPSIAPLYGHGYAKTTLTRDDSPPQQQTLPTGPSHIGARPARTPEQQDSNRDFLAAAGRVEFERKEATLQAVWMAVAYFASLGEERECYATVDHIGEKAHRSERTVRRHLNALIERGLLETDHRRGGHVPTKWRVVLPTDGWVGRTEWPGRADRMAEDIRDHSSTRASASRDAPPDRSSRVVRTKGTGSAPRSEAVAPPPIDPRESGYGCELCHDTGMCPTEAGDRVRPCDCRSTNPVILERQAKRRRI